MHLKEHICLFYNLSFKTGIAVTIQTIVMTEEEQTSGGTEWLYQNCRLTTTMSYQHLQSICDFYYLFNKASHWHHEVLDRLSFRDVLDQMPMKESDTSNMVYVSLLWRRHCRAVLSQMPPQIPEEWMELAKLSFLFSENIKKQGIQLSSRCLLLWNILTSHSGHVNRSDLQQVMSWKQNVTPASPFPGLNVSAEIENHLPESSLDVNPYHFSTGRNKALCELKNVQHAKLQTGKLLPAKAEYFNSDTTGHSMYGFMNPWLSLPLTNFSNRQPVNMGSNAREDFFHKPAKNESDHIFASTNVHASVALNCRSKGVQVPGARAVATHNCEVLTDDHQLFKIFKSKKKYNPERDVTGYAISKNEDEMNPNTSTVFDNCNFELFRGLMDYSRTTDWVLKEQETLCTIEDQLLRTEAILKGSYVEYKHNDTGENKTCKRYKNLDSPASDYCGNNDIPDSRIKKQKYSINLFRELEEMYAIEECIFEENKKIEEFREVVQSAAVEEQANLFNQCKDKLLFWTLLDRERNHVDNLEKSLAREEATKQKHLRKKIDMAKIKKYCQDVIKENIKLLSEYHCQHCKDAKSESPKNTLTKEVGSLSLNNHTQLLPAQNHAVMGEAGTVVMPEKDSVTLE
ncbi:uncharacterized protein LOC142144191 isoform X2 [Mixophyes fleayi]|uniref:uncharacterized protein LOC142144191 isoform X2 n=1 Tax=Mixophyes fleayi TaxID=3061075 RepID=UPI003F4E2684